MFGWMFPVMQSVRERKRRKAELAEYQRQTESIRDTLIPFMASGDAAFAELLCELQDESPQFSREFLQKHTDAKAKPAEINRIAAPRAIDPR